MILRALGNVVLGSHPDPDFYARLSKRSAPTLGESAAALRTRVKTNLQRDYVTKSVAIRICIFALVSFIALSFVSGAYELSGFSTDAQIRKTQMRNNQKIEHIWQLEAPPKTETEKEATDEQF